MKIEIAEHGRMSQTGSSLLRLIQNNNMPILDLLVRESIQNSLDAKVSDARYVDVEFITGKFDKANLNNELEKVTQKLNARYRGKDYDFLAIRDTNTEGLTGPLRYEDVRNNEYGNLLKLIYEISKPQDVEGSGGSWGLGKTVYFRVGIGLVLYYSRIRKGPGKYESRLAASFVEDETKKDAIIPESKNIKRGIAWWGTKPIGSSQTVPITKKREIQHILKIFNIPEYTGSQTGTTIIIPYIKVKELLNNNAGEYLDRSDKKITPYWMKSLEDYLQVAVQRWYAPRLNNIDYRYGPFLRVKVNGKGLSDDEMIPVFKKIRGLYNAAFEIDEGVSQEKMMVTPIKIRKALAKSTSGKIVYFMANKMDLQMLPPHNNHNPYIHVNCEIDNPEHNKPIVCYVRKPAMIVSYETRGNWTDQIAPTDKDHYLIALFVLNSDNTLQIDNSFSLEEYIRRSEMADHSSWGDFSVQNENPKISAKIQNNVRKVLSAVTKESKTEKPKAYNSGLGKRFGELLLPPENFGTRSSPGKTKARVPSIGNRNVKLYVDQDNIQYSRNNLELSLSIETSGEVDSVGFELAVDSEAGSIRFQEWVNKLSMPIPFEITRADIECVSGKKKRIVFNIDMKNGIVENDHMKAELVRTDDYVGYGVRISSAKAKKLTVNISLNIIMYKKDIQPSFILMRSEVK